MEKVVTVVVTVPARSYSKVHIQLLYVAATRFICARNSSMEALYLISLLILLCCSEFTIGKHSHSFNIENGTTLIIINF